MGANGNGVGASLAGLRLLSKDEILAAPDLERETVPTPEWGEGSAVLVQALDVNRRLAYSEFVFEIVANPETGRRDLETRMFTPYNAALAALGIVDAAGEPVFTITEVEQLGTKNPAVIGRIADAVRRLSKMTAADVEVRGENLKEPSADSPTDSPVTSA